MGLFSKKSKTKEEATLVYDNQGAHSIGGAPPANVILPELETSPVVYLGQIGKDEAVLDSIDFDLHLMCPIFLNIYEAVFFDYSDPLSPKLIKENVSTDFSQYFPDIQGTDLIEYHAVKFSFDQSKPPSHEMPYEGEIGHTGEPNWIQYEQWPNCPINGNKMQFLFQLGDIDNCKTKIGQDILDKEYVDDYLNFGHGYLYIFYEPESKVVAYLNQLT